MHSLHFILITLSFSCSFSIFLPNVQESSRIKTSKDYVKLHGPTDVTPTYIGTKDVFIFWYAPSNYEVQCVGELSTLEIKAIHDELNGSFSDDGVYFDGSSHKSKEADLSRVDGVWYNTQSSRNDTNSTTAEESGSLTNASSEVAPSDSVTNNNGSDVDMNNTVTHSTTPTPKKCFHKHSRKTIVFSTNDSAVVLKSQSRILYYNVTCRLATGGPENNTKVDPSTTDFVIKDLTPNTTYTIAVAVTYASGDVLWSDDKNFTTVKRNCLCDPVGSQESSLNCHVNQLFQRHIRRICHCKTGHAGMFCQHCAFGWYRLSRKEPCYPCPCKPHHSNTGCHFEEGMLFCDVCGIGYTGNLCQECDLGFYRDRSSRTCRRCQCHGNSDYCNSMTGECTGCMYNTAGFSCERCAHDYVGDAKKQNCVHKSEAGGQHGSLPNGVIAVICVLVILVICAIVGLIIYRKYHSYPIPRPFWTIELKDDHEGVNFSTVPEDEDRLVFNDDSEFYEKQGGKRGRDGAQKYSPLEENT